jgi:hypothetical protein
MLGRRVLLLLALATTGCNALWGNEPAQLFNENPRMLVFDNSASAKDLDDFPVLVVLDSTRLAYEDVEDPTTQLRFHDPDTGADLAFEVERWDPLGASYIWVRVPKIDAGSTTDRILMYYGADAAGIEQPSEMWSSFDFVFHGTADRLASSIGDYPGTAIGISAAEGAVADALRLQGPAQSIVRFANTSPLLDGWGAFTIELWIFADYTAASSPPDPVAVVGNGSSVGAGHLKRPDPYGRVPDPLLLTLDLYFANAGGNASEYSTIVPLQNWVYAAYTMDGQTLWTYTDGAFTDTATWATPRQLRASTSTAELVIGASTDAFAGMIDELRVSRSYRDAEWVNAQYLSMTGKFVSFVTPGHQL